MKQETIKVWLDEDTTIVSGTNKDVLINLILRSYYNVVDGIETLEKQPNGEIKEDNYWNVELIYP